MIPAPVERVGQDSVVAALEVQVDMAGPEARVDRVRDLPIPPTSAVIWIALVLVLAGAPAASVAAALAVVDQALVRAQAPRAAVPAE